MYADPMDEFHGNHHAVYAGRPKPKLRPLVIPKPEFVTVVRDVTMGDIRKEHKPREKEVCLPIK